MALHLPAHSCSWRGIRAGLTVIFLCLCAFSGRAECAKLFSTQSLSSKGRTLAVIPADLDGRGPVEIVVISRTGVYPNEKRWVSIFSADDSARYSAAPRQRWEVDPKATMFEVGDVAPSAGQEIFFLTAHGIRYCAKDESGAFSTASHALFSSATATVFPAAGSLPRMKLLADWRRDGRAALMLPQFDSLVLFDRDGAGGWWESQRVAITPRTFLYGDQEDDGALRDFSLRADFRLPRIFAEDFNGDGRADLLLTQQKSISVHIQKSDGTFEPDASVTAVLPVRPSGQEADGDLSLMATPADVNGDGFADVVLTRTRGTGGFLERTTEVFLFLNRKRPGAPFPMEPDQTITFDGITPGVTIQDVNGDGRQDLLLSHIRLGFWNVVKNLVSKRVDVHTAVYLLQSDDRYATTPDFRQKNGYRLNLTHGIRFRGIWPSLDGDFTGDGHPDLLIAHDGQVTVHAQDSDGELFSQSHSQTDVFTAPCMHICDLNRDGRNDLLFYEKGQKGRISVLLNSGKWEAAVSSQKSNVHPERR